MPFPVKLYHSMLGHIGLHEPKLGIQLSNDDHLAPANRNTRARKANQATMLPIDSHDEDTTVNPTYNRDHHMLEYIDLEEPKLGVVHLSNDDHHLAPDNNKDTRTPASPIHSSHDEDTTNHTYRDHRLEPDKEKTFSTKGGVDMPFPVKLYHMLEYIDLHEPKLANIISWQPHGRSFMCHDAAKMEKIILPIFFNHSNFNSYRRQLNMWGFIRLNKEGPDNGAYYHDLFLRSKRYLCRDIKKKKRSRFLASQEPRFYAMTAMSPHSIVSSVSSKMAGAHTSSSPCSRSSSTGPSLEEEQDSALNYWFLSSFETPPDANDTTSASSTKRNLQPITRQSCNPCPSSPYTMPDIVHQEDTKKTNIRSAVAESRSDNNSVGAGTLFTTTCLHNWQREWQWYADSNGIGTGRLEQEKAVTNGEGLQKSLIADFLSPFAIGHASPMTNEEEKETLAVLAKIGRL